MSFLFDSASSSETFGNLFDATNGTSSNAKSKASGGSNKGPRSTTATSVNDGSKWPYYLLWGFGRIVSHATNSILGAIFSLGCLLFACSELRYYFLFMTCQSEFRTCTGGVKSHLVVNQKIKNRNLLSSDFGHPFIYVAVLSQKPRTTCRPV